jgi:Tol biopolymer transport system component
MDADGSNQQRLTNSVGDDIHPSWSPDGTRLVFARLDVGLFVIDANGSGETPLTNDGSEPAWSPDGTRIAFVSGRDGFARIYTMAPDGSQVVPLTQDPNGAYAPAWSPNSLQIVFAEEVIGFGGHLFIMEADGTRVTPLTRDPIRGDNTPDWSPDGTRIAFGSVGNGTSHINTINPDGSDFVDLTDDQTAAHERPSWIR